MKRVRADSLQPGDVYRAGSGARRPAQTFRARVRSVRKQRGKLRIAFEYAGGGEGEEVLSPGAKVPLIHRVGEPPPPKRTKVEYLAELESRLARFEPRFTRALRALLKKRVPREAARLDFEVHWSPLTRDFPVAAYFMDGGNAQLDYRAVSRAKLFRWNELGPFHEDGVDTEEAHTPRLLDFFLRSWEKAGGREYRLAGIAQLHDETWAIDLRTLQRRRL